MDHSEMEVDIVTSCLKESVFTSDLEEKGICFFELSGNQRRLFKNNQMFRTLLRERNYDVIHFNLFQGLSLRFTNIAKQEQIPIRIVHSHGTGLRNSKTKQLKMMLHHFGKHLWAKSATRYWACSQPAAEFLFPHNVPVEIIPNGIETERFRFSAETRMTVRNQLGINGDQLLIGTVGRLSEEKNQKFLIDVFLHIHANQPNCRLLLVGDGPLRKSLFEYAQTLGVSDCVIFYGISQSVETLLCAMDLFVFPSQMEGLGIAAVEAQASGLPVLCSDRIPSEARLTAHLKALSLDVSAQVWAEEALRLLSNPVQREKGADEVNAAGFDIHNIACRMEKHFLC